jgi:hypothetical protein
LQFLVGNVCIAIAGTPTADDLLYDLIAAVQPYNLLENLTSAGNFEPNFDQSISNFNFVPN